MIRQHRFWLGFFFFKLTAVRFSSECKCSVIIYAFQERYKAHMLSNNTLKKEFGRRRSTFKLQIPKSVTSLHVKKFKDSVTELSYS